MRARDRGTAAALRGALSAIDQAEAVAADGHEATIGALGDVARRELTTADVTRVLRAEIVEHERAAAFHRERGEDDRAGVLMAQARAVARFLPDGDDPGG